MGDLRDTVHDFVVQVGHTLSKVEAEAEVFKTQSHGIDLVTTARQTTNRPSPFERDWPRGVFQCDLNRWHCESVDSPRPNGGS